MYGPALAAGDMRYVAEYAQETHDRTLLELVRLNSNLMRCLHLRELKELSVWWRDLYDTVNLKYSRDRMVEIYFWSCGMIPEEELSRARLMFAKAFGIVSILDDTYDVHATAEECRSLTEAMQRFKLRSFKLLSRSHVPILSADGTKVRFLFYLNTCACCISKH